MFDIQLGNTPSPVNVVDKQFDVYNTQQGVLRAGTSIIDPVITIQCDNSDMWRKSMNYAYIEAFGRYYYITNIISKNGTLPSEQWPSPAQLWEVHMHVDVLKTYADQIKAQTAIVARQENTFNLMLDDGSFMAYQNPKLQTKRFSVEGPFEHQEFVLVVAGS